MKNFLPRTTRNTRKKIISNTLILFLITNLFVLVNCRKSENRDQPLTIYSLRGPAGIAMIKLFEEPPKIDGFKVNVEALAQSDLMAARLISGEAKIGILPPNVAAKIFNSGAADLRIAAVTGTGMLSLLTSDPNISSLRDLKGKTVYATGHGTVVDYVFKRILWYHRLEAGVDVELNYSLAYPEVAQSLIAGKVDIALLPEPFATMARLGKPNLFDVCDVQEMWKETLLGSQYIYDEKALIYPISVFVIEGTFADEHPDAVRIILKELESSLQWVVSYPKDAAELVEKHELAIRANVAEAAIPKSNYTFISAVEARPSLEAVFVVFLENDPASIGGALPMEAFYLK